MKRTAIALTALLIFAGCGKSGGSDPQTTPRACFEALDRAERLMEISAQAFDLAHDGIIAASVGNNAELNRVAAEIGDLTEQVDRAGYDAAAAECRS